MSSPQTRPDALPSAPKKIAAGTRKPKTGDKKVVWSPAWKVGASVVHVTGRRPLTAALLVAADKTGFRLRYGSQDEVSLPATERRHVQVVNPIQWPVRLRREPARVLADFYKSGAVTRSGLDALMAQLEREAGPGKSPATAIRLLLTRLLIEEAKAALKAEAGAKAARAKEEKEDVGRLLSTEDSFYDAPDPSDEADAADEGEGSAEAVSAEPVPAKKSPASITKVARAGPWLREFVLHVAEDGGGKPSDQWWALQTAWRKGWVKTSAYAPLLREILLRAGSGVEATKASKDEANRLAAAVRREIAGFGRPPGDVLRACLLTADSTAVEFATLADWSWSQINDRPEIDNQTVLKEAVASAPRWTLKTLWLTLRPTLAGLPLGTAFPPGLANARYRFLLSLLLDDPRGQGYYLSRFSEVVSREPDKESTASALLSLLADTAVPRSSATAIARQVTAAAPLRIAFLDALCREERSLDDVFAEILGEHGVQPADWLSWAASPGVKPSKANILADVIKQSLGRLSDALKAGGEFEGGLGSRWTCAGLLAFLDANAATALPPAAPAGAVPLWEHFLRTEALPSLSQAQQNILAELMAPLQADLVKTQAAEDRSRAESAALRQEVKRYSDALGAANNPLATTAGWAQDLISLIDDLDRQLLQSPAQAGTLGRTIKLLLVTLKKNKVNTLDVGPGDVVARSRWQSAPSDFKVFEDSVEAETLTVVQRGFVLEEALGQREVLRPALLDQPFE